MSKVIDLSSVRELAKLTADILEARRSAAPFIYQLRHVSKRLHESKHPALAPYAVTLAGAAAAMRQLCDVIDALPEPLRPDYDLVEPPPNEYEDSFGDAPL